MSCVARRFLKVRSASRRSRPVRNADVYRPPPLPGWRPVRSATAFAWSSTMETPSTGSRDVYRALGDRIRLLVVDLDSVSGSSIRWHDLLDHLPLEDRPGSHAILSELDPVLMEMAGSSVRVRHFAMAGTPLTAAAFVVGSRSCHVVGWDADLSPHLLTTILTSDVR